MNFTTDLPKQDPICSYLVATGKVDDECYRMHVVVNSNEYNKEYRRSDVLRELKSKMEGKSTSDREKDKQKLLPCDRNSNTERIILCHVIRINTKLQAGATDADKPTRANESRKRSRNKQHRKKKTKAIPFEDSETESLSSQECAEDTITDEEQLYEEDLRIQEQMQQRRATRGLIQKKNQISELLKSKSLLKSPFSPTIEFAKKRGRPRKEQKCIEHSEILSDSDKENFNPDILDGMSTVVPLKLQNNSHLFAINNPEESEDCQDKLQSLDAEGSVADPMLCQEVFAELTPIKALTPAKYDFIIPKFKSQF